MILKTALITGASSGIGKEFAHALARKQDCNLILVARDAEKLTAVKESIESIWKASTKTAAEAPFIIIESIDLASKPARDDLLLRLGRDQRTIDLLINNAGIVYRETFGSSDAALNNQMMDVNCAAPLHLCRMLLPNMQKNGAGSIINVCSTLALMPMPRFSCYAASKAFLLHFSVALANEVRDQGIKVLALCPGATDTPGHRARHPVGEKNLLGCMSAEKIATLGLKALENNSVVCIPGILNRLVFGALRIIPVTLSAKILGMLAVRNS
jgi:short-subunit dehydrogenase